jgi:hypothetical protein
VLSYLIIFIAVTRFKFTTAANSLILQHTSRPAGFIALTSGTRLRLLSTLLQRIFRPNRRRPFRSFRHPKGMHSDLQLKHFIR